MTAARPEDRRVRVARKILEQETHCTPDRLPMAHDRLISAVWMLLDVINGVPGGPAKPAVSTATAFVRSGRRRTDERPR